MEDELRDLPRRRELERHAAFGLLDNEGNCTPHAPIRLQISKFEEGLANAPKAIRDECDKILAREEEAVTE